MDYTISTTFKLMVWIKVVPLKIFIFAWSLILNSIPTKDNLVRRLLLLIQIRTVRQIAALLKTLSTYFSNVIFVVEFGLLYTTG